MARLVWCHKIESRRQPRRAAVVLRTTTSRSGVEHRSRSRAFTRRARPSAESPDAALRECPSGFPRRAAPLIVINLSPQDPAVQGDSVKKLMLAGLVAVLGFAPVFALAQAQAEEKILVGQVQSVDQSGTQLTLKDGTTLLTPPGATLRPGALQEGTLVVAMYREQENGDKVLTRLSLGKSEPASATPSESPKRPE